MKRTLAVSVVTGLNIALAIGIQFYVLFQFGVGADTDAHVASQTLPVLAGSLLTAMLPQALVPILIARRDPVAAAWAITRTLALISIPAALVLIVGAPMWVPLLFSGFPDATLAIAVELSRIQMVSVVAAAMLAAPLARLYADNRVLTSEVSFFGASLLALSILPVLSSRYGIVGASVALLVRPFSQLVCVLVAIGRPETRADAVDLRAKVWQQIRPLAGSAPLYKLGPVVDRLIGSFAQAGHLTLLIYGQHAWSVGLTMIDRVVGKPLLANVSRMIFERRLSEARATYLVHLRWVGVITTVGFVVFWLVGEPVLKLVSDMTRLSPSDASQLYTMCLVLGGVWIAGGVGQISLAVVYGLGDVRTVTRIAVVSFVIATALKAALLPTFGVMGIAIGAVFYQAANFVALHRFVMRATQ